MKRTIKKEVVVLSTAILAMIGCGGSSKSESPIKNLEVQACNESLSDEQVKQADSLILLGNASVVDDMETFFQGVDDGKWESMQSGSPVEADEYYSAALDVAPGYCKAQMAKAITASMRIVEDKEIDSFMDKMTSDDSDLGANASVFEKAFNIKSEDDIPNTLFRINSNAATNNEISTEEVYDLITKEFYPRLDTAIARLEGVYEYEDFEFEIVVDGKIHQFDRGEIGPLLGGLKILKSFVIAAVARDFNSDLNGSMEWIEIVDNIDREDFDDLSSEQKAALDHATSLIKGQKGFGDLKSEWKDLYKSIPDILSDAVDNIKGGLEYGIYEAENNGDQDFDLYVVGTGVNSDVNPSDLKDGIEFLTRIQKYLDGKQTIAWSNGTVSTDLNVPAIFEINNPFKKLPYFEIRPYDEWNNVLSADTGWSSYIGEVDRKKISELSGFDTNNENIMFNLSMSGIDQYDLMIYDLDQGVISTVGVLSIASTNECAAKYQKVDVQGAVDGSPIDYAFTACRAGETYPYVSYIDSRYEAPFYFTDANGKMTLDLADEDFEPNSILDFKGKIIFPDPTFEGVFPKFTNDNMWATLDKLDEVSDRVENEAPICDQWGWCEEGAPILPTNPSDLDFFIYFTSK